MEAKSKKEVQMIVAQEIEKTLPTKEFLEMKKELETLTRHFTKYEKSKEDGEILILSMNESVKNIEARLTPNKLNDNKGLITEFETLKTAFIKLQGLVAIHSVYFWMMFVVFVTGGILSYFINSTLPHK